MSILAYLGDFVRTLRDWFGFRLEHASHGHSHSEGGGHGHTHGVIDATIATTDRGIWAIKWSFVILAITAALQIVVVVFSGSVALLADTIHNVGDATTAIPLWIAFMLARRRPTQTFTYGYGRVEDLAGILIVLIILFSAIVAGYVAIDRLVHPQQIAQIEWVAMAGIIGFLGNEIVAVFRIRVGREINSAALIADGYHARTDGLTSLAVVLGAVGVWLGFPLADPIIGLLITIAIFGIVWQSARSVLTRMLDGVEPSIIAELRHAAEHVPGIDRITDVKARWVGHKLHSDMTIVVNEALPLAQANLIAAALKKELFAHFSALTVAHVRFFMTVGTEPAEPAHGHHHAPEPFRFFSKLAEGVLTIVDTAFGERMCLTVTRHSSGLRSVVVIDRPGGIAETLPLIPSDLDHHCFISAVAPAEPHEFDARLQLDADGQQEVLPFRMVEPEHHH
jgi:cation diffusion facilitator family transporter